MSTIEGAALAWQRRTALDNRRRGNSEINVPSLSVKSKSFYAQDEENESGAPVTNRPLPRKSYSFHPTSSRVPSVPPGPVRVDTTRPVSARMSSRWDGLLSRVMNLEDGKIDHEDSDEEENSDSNPVNRRYRHSTGSLLRSIHQQMLLNRSAEEDENLPTPDEINRENQESDDFFGASKFIDKRVERWPYLHEDSMKLERAPSHRKQSVGGKSGDTTEPLIPTEPTIELREIPGENSVDGPSRPKQAHIAYTSKPQVETPAKASWRHAIDKAKIVKKAANYMSPEAVKREIHAVGELNNILPLVLMAVPFVAIRTDEHGRKPPPVLVDVIELAITDSEIDTSAITQRYIFRIELRYAEVKWVCKRTLADFVAMHTALNIKSLRGLGPRPPPFPSQLYYVYQTMKAATGWDETQRGARKEKVALERRKYLQEYLIKLLSIFKMSISYDLFEFLEISAMSITKDMGWKGKEGHLENKVNFLRPSLCQGLVIRTWTSEWVMLRDSYIVFANSIGSTTPTDVFLFDKNFQVTREAGHLIAPYSYHHITIANKQRSIYLKGTSTRVMDDWMESLKSARETSPWIRVHRFESFAPVRKDAKVRWFVDAKDYFYAVSEAILAAKQEIYIEDWWLSPELYLRRPPSQYPDFRLDRLLLRKAKEGVMIYIVVYKEMAAALTLNSAYTKATLQHLHRNIVVQRHPDHGLDGGVLFWAHHEKMVIVDSCLAFIGGLDLCYGRYDTHTHHLADFHPSGDNFNGWHGQDFSNPRIKDFINVQNCDSTLIDRGTFPRMPWHDIALAMVGRPARDVARHFIQRWNYIKTQKSTQRTIVPFLTPKGEYAASRDESKFKGTCRVQLLRSSAMWSSGVEREHSIYNAYVGCILKAEHFIYIENQFFITSTTDDAKDVVKNKIGQAIVTRILRAHNEQKKFRVIVVMPLAPAFEGDISAPDAGTLRLVMHWQYQSISRGGSSIFEKLHEHGINPEEYISFFSLRSFDRINNPNIMDILNLQTPQSPPTINTAVAPGSEEPKVSNSPPAKSKSEDLDAGENISKGVAKGNIKSSEDAPPLVSIINDSIAGHAMQTSEEQEALFEKFANDESDMEKYNFVTEQLYIHSKLLIVDDRVVICGSANLNDRSQLGNRDSEIALLVEDQDMIEIIRDGKPTMVSRFAYELRIQIFKEHLGLLPCESHEFYDEPPATPDQLDSFQNTDDEATNIIRVFEKRVPTITNKTSASNSNKSNNTNEDSMDPLSNEFYNGRWLKTAMENTEIFRDIFKCVPDDTVHSLDDFRNFTDTSALTGHVASAKSRTSDEVRSKLARVKGHLVLFPMEFLKSENLVGSVIREAVVPMEIFT